MPEWQQSSTIVSLHPDGSGAMSVSKTYARRHRGLLPSVATRSRGQKSEERAHCQKMPKVEETTQHQKYLQ